MTTISSKRNKLSEHLSQHAPVILDGALATYLESLGADISGSLWSAEILLQQPLLIKQTHLDYFRAGAQVAITASYQASTPGLIKHFGMNEAHAKAIIKKSVKLAKEARDDYVVETMTKLTTKDQENIEAGGVDIAEHEASIRNRLFIAGSVGPYGAFLADGSEYRGDYAVAKEDMKAFHRGRIEALIEADVDVLACETIPSKAEVEALLELLTTEFGDTEAWFSFTLRDSQHISDGTPLSKIAALFDGVDQVVALGVNCVSDDVVLGALKVLQPLRKRGTLLVYPNSGEQWNAHAREWEGERTKGSDLATKTKAWWDAGAGLIGGCCRTTPEDIRVMRQAINTS